MTMFRMLLIIVCLSEVYWDYYLRSSTEMRPKAAFRCGWNRRPIHWTSEKLSALSDVIYTVSHG